MRNISNRFAMKPLSGLDMSGVNAALYACRENTGVVVNDKFGNHDALTIAGTAGTQLTSNPGWLKPNGTDNTLTLPVALNPDFDNPDGAWLFACRFFRTADNSVADTLFGIGNGPDGEGEFGMEIGSTGTAALRTRGVGASAVTSNAFGTFDMTTYNGNANGVDLAFVLLGNVWPTLVANLYVNGNYVGNRSRNLTTDGGTAFPVVTEGAMVCARRNSAALSSPMGLNAAAARISNILVYKQDSYDAALMANVIREHHLYPGEKIRSLA
jgi:hypothetical protein